MRSVLFRAVAAGVALMLLLAEAPAQTVEEITKEKIIAASRKWQEKYDQYKPAADMVDTLKARLGTGLTIEVYLGLWCRDSLNNVPRFIKTLDLLATPLPVRYFSVSRKPSKHTKYYFEALKVERVPTFILYRDGKEIGRIVENPRTGIIEDLIKIVSK